MMTGNHDNDQLPVVMLGRGGGQIKTGRVLDYLGKPNRKMCSLYLSLMDKVGRASGPVRRLEGAAGGNLNLWESKMLMNQIAAPAICRDRFRDSGDPVGFACRAGAADSAGTAKASQQWLSLPGKAGSGEEAPARDSASC